MAWRRLIGLLPMMALWGCRAKPAAVPPSAPAIVSSDLPTLRQLPIAIALEDEPEQGYFGLAVSPEGKIAFIASLTSSPAIRVVDTTGSRLAAFGRQGEGPGEVRTPNRIEWVGDSLLIATKGVTIARFNATGRFLEEYRTDFVGSLLGFSRDSFDGISHTGSNGVPQPGVVRVALTSGKGRLLNGAQDSVASVFVRNRKEWEYRLIPYGKGPGIVAFGDGLRYLIEAQDGAGRTLYLVHRELPARTRGKRELRLRQESLKQTLHFRGPNGQRATPADIEKQLADAATEPVPHFDRAPLFFDGKNRLWVFGTANDSTVADIFAGNRFLGRVTFPCFNRYGWRSLVGTWLVMGCEADDGVDTQSLKLYRIEG